MIEHGDMRVRPISGSGQATLRHRNENCLMLLGSPPDMVHSCFLRKTHPSTLSIKPQTTHNQPSNGEIYLCWSGLQIQGTADSPAGMTQFHVLLQYIITDYLLFCKRYSVIFLPPAACRERRNRSCASYTAIGGQGKERLG